MYSVSIESGFSAVHRVHLPDGSLEPLNGHDWRVRVWYESAALNEFGMVLDFEQARSALDDVLEALHKTNLNENPALEGGIPTAEVLAEWLYRRLDHTGPEGLARVEVTEKPGCVATFTPGSSAHRTD